MFRITVNEMIMGIINLSKRPIAPPLGNLSFTAASCSESPDLRNHDSKQAFLILREVLMAS